MNQSRESLLPDKSKESYKAEKLSSKDLSGKDEASKCSSRLRALSLGFLLSGMIFLTNGISAFSQTSTPTQDLVKLTSADFISKQDGWTVERLIEFGNSRRADLLAARQRLAIAEGKLIQARLRPNPTLDVEYASSRFLNGEPESAFSVGVTQVFELGRKRQKRIAVAEAELNQVRAEITALERRFAADVRASYTKALATARQLDVLEKLITANEELIRAVEARLKEGDVAPLDVNLVRVETDRLKIQAIQAKSELETEFLNLKGLIGMDINERLRLAPQPERPPRLDLGLNELIKIALNERADLQAARFEEQLSKAQIDLAKANAIPNVSGSVRYTDKKLIIDLPPVFGVNQFPQTDKELSFGFSVDIPIFNRNQGEIASTKSQQLQATRKREFLEATIKRDVAVAYRKYRTAAEQLVLYTTQILPRSEENLRSIRAAYGFGEFSVFEVINEQRRLMENVTGYNQALQDYYTALAELETAIGTTIPPSGFSTNSDSILPDTTVVPTQVDREKLLKSLEDVQLPKKKISTNTEVKKQP